MGRPGSFPRPLPRHQEYARVKGTRLIEKFSGGSSLQARADEVARPYKEGPKALWQIQSPEVMTICPFRMECKNHSGLYMEKMGISTHFKELGTVLH